MKDTNKFSFHFSLVPACWSLAFANPAQPYLHANGLSHRETYYIFIMPLLQEGRCASTDAVEPKNISIQSPVLSLRTTFTLTCNSRSLPLTWTDGVWCLRSQIGVDELTTTTTTIIHKGERAGSILSAKPVQRLDVCEMVQLQSGHSSETSRQAEMLMNVNVQYIQADSYFYNVHIKHFPRFQSTLDSHR